MNPHKILHKTDHSALRVVHNTHTHTHLQHNVHEACAEAGREGRCKSSHEPLRRVEDCRHAVGLQDDDAGSTAQIVTRRREEDGQTTCKRAYSGGVKRVSYPPAGVCKAVA